MDRKIYKYLSHEDADAFQATFAFAFALLTVVWERNQSKAYGPAAYLNWALAAMRYVYIALYTDNPPTMRAYRIGDIVYTLETVQTVLTDLDVITAGDFSQALGTASQALDDFLDEGQIGPDHDYDGPEPHDPTPADIVNAIRTGDWDHWGYIPKPKIKVVETEDDIPF